MRADFKRNDFNAYEVREEFLTQLPPVNATVCFACGVSTCGAVWCRPGLISFVSKSFSNKLQISDNLKDKKKGMAAIIIKIC